MSDNRIKGCLFGLACGDALGAETEFLNMHGILEQFPPDGPADPPGQPAKVTDDTQMTIAVSRALIMAKQPITAETLQTPLQDMFIEWYNDEENNRAPGNTCLEGCENLIAGKPWHEAGNISSKGCGANMRVAPAALLKGVDEATRAAIAQYQAAFTHAHPTALAASDLTSFVVHYLLTGGIARDVLHMARQYARSQRDVYHHDWLGDLWQRAYMMRDAREYIAHGWNECLEALERVTQAPKVLNYNDDPCEYTGAGWIAEEAFATGLYCFLLYSENPVKALRRAAASSGDSDSIACITGAFIGAYHGFDALPYNWTHDIEYRDELHYIADKLSEI